jgi:dTDP-4-dehydrorhamnose 3,5-epimerase
MAVKTTIFTPHATEIPGLLVWKQEYPGDSRGYFREVFHKQKLVAEGLPEEFKIEQVNHSENTDKGVIRGFHAEPWAKYATVGVGKVFGAYVDLRKGDSFGMVVTVELDRWTVVYVPRGVGNSFQNLEHNTLFCYCVPQHWRQEDVDEGKYSYANLADPEIGVKWPIPLAESIMSDADKKHPMLRDVKPMEI